MHAIHCERLKPTELIETFFSLSNSDNLFAHASVCERERARSQKNLNYEYEFPLIQLF